MSGIGGSRREQPCARINVLVSTPALLTPPVDERRRCSGSPCPLTMDAATGRRLQLTCWVGATGWNDYGRAGRDLPGEVEGACGGHVVDGHVRHVR